MTEQAVGFRLTADLSQFSPGMAQARREFEGFQRTVSGGAKDAAASLDGLVKGLKGAAGLYAASEVASYARALGETADAAATVRSRLGLVAGSVQNTGQVYGELFKIAQQTRVGFSDLAETYSRLARAGDESGISQTRMLAATQALSQAITVSGGSAASANAAMVQLAQGLASGTLRGDELNSILEQTPRVAQAIAQGLGIGIGQLRKFGEEGRLTTDVVIGALERSAPAIAAEFARMTPTISQALATLSNSGLNFVGVMDQMTGASANTARGIMGIGTAFDWLARKIQENPDLFAGLAGGALGGAAGAQFNLQQRRAEQLMAAAEAQARGPEQSDSILSRRAGEIAREQMRRDSARAILDDPRFLSKGQRRKIDVDKAGADFRASISGRGDVPEAEMDTARARYLQAIANIEDKYKEDKPAGAAAARAAATDALQARRTAVAERVAAVRDGAKLEQDIIVSEGRQGLRTEESVIRERSRLQLEAIAQQRSAASELVKLAGADLSEKARATADIAKLDRERAATERQMTNELAELAARRTAALDAEARAGRQAKFDQTQAVRESIVALEDENRAKRIAIATGEDEAVVLRQLAIERIEANLALDERPDPATLERLTLLRQELALMRERSSLVPDEAPAAVQAQQYTDVERSLTDALLRGFENGKSFAQNFRDTLVNTFKTAVLRPLIEPIVKPVGNAVTGLIEQGLSALLGASMQVGGADGAVLDGGSALSLSGADIRGRRAMGGPVSPFGTYLVGEEGPELLRMGRQGGAVMPNPATTARMGGGGVTVNQTLNFDFTNSIGVANVVEQAAQRGAAMGAQMAQSQLEQRRRNGEAV